jgi:hypothetical protein
VRWGLHREGTRCPSPCAGGIPLTLGSGLGAGPQPRLQGQVQEEEGGSARGQHGVGSSHSLMGLRATAALLCLGVPRRRAVPGQGPRRLHR